VFFRPHGDDHFTIARKSSEHLMAMLQLVYDNDYLVDSILELGWPPRWADDQSATEGSSPSWTTEDHRVFSNDGASSEEQWLRYRHIVPSSEDWAYLSQGQMPPYGVRHNPKLVTDFTAYNSGLSISPTTSNVGLIENLSTPSEPRFLARQNPDSMGLNWVGDLALSCELTSESEQGEALFELVEGGVRFQCRIDLSTGLATMLIPGEATFEPVEAETRIRGTGTWKVMFANIDEQLRLWVDRKEIAFPRGAVYQLPLDRDPTEADAMPARIGTFQAALTVDHLQLHRDLYYIAQTNQSPCDIKPFPYVPLNHNTVNSVLSNPLNWSNFGTTHSLEFDMKKEQFLALGDNSASSSDSRLWMSQHHVPHYVPEAYLVGKALLVYWPHGHPVPGMKDLHLIPNVQKMRFIE
jgi:signal peptidase I